MNGTLSVRLPFKKGRLIYVPDTGSALIPADWTFATRLTGVLADGRGRVLDEFDWGSGLVTATGVKYLTDDWAGGAQDIGLLKNHGTGTGTTAEAVTQTALITAIGTTATAGTIASATSGNNATVTAVATVAYTTTSAVTEWGLFSSTTLSGATMWDRRQFTAVNVVNGDSIQFTYTLTVNSGG